MDLNYLLTFKAVADAGSFTAAAEKLGVPKSNVSRRVSTLENDLGVRLLERSTRSLNLTEVGASVYRHSQAIQEEVEGAQRCIEDLTAVPKGWLRVSTSISLGQSLLGPILPAFQARYPDVHVDLSLLNRRVDLIDEGYDLAVRAGPSKDSLLISRFLCSVNMRLYASADYLSQIKAPLTVEQLKSSRCLYMSGAGAGKPSWPRLDGEPSLPLKPTFICDDFNTLLVQVSKGAGIALLPDYLVQSLAPHLVTVLEEDIGSTVDLYTLYPSRKGATPKLRAFLDFIFNHFNASVSA